MGGKHSHGPGVQRAIFHRMWDALVALIVAQTLRAIFSRKELMDLRQKEFVDPGKVDSFLEWATRQEKLSKHNGNSAYRANISTIRYLPDKIQQQLKKQRLLDRAMLTLARLANTTTHILGVADVELAFSTLEEGDEVELTDEQVLIILAHLVEAGSLSEVGANQYVLAKWVQPPANHRPVAETALVDVGADDSSIGDLEEVNGRADPSPKTQVVDSFSATLLPEERVAMVGGTTHVGISIDNLERCRSLFLATWKGPFQTNAKRRTKALEFFSTAAFTNSMVWLHQAGWIKKGEKRGWWEWVLEKVPAEWRNAIKEEGLPTSTITEVAEVHFESIATIVGEDESASAQVAVAEDQPVVVEPTPEPMVDTTPPREPQEEAQTSQPDLVTELAEAHRRLVELEKENDALTEIVIDMMCGHMRYMHEDLQVRILGGLAIKIGVAQTFQPDLIKGLADAYQRLVEQEGENDFLTETVIKMMYGHLRYKSKQLQARILGGLAAKLNEKK